MERDTSAAGRAARFARTCIPTVLKRETQLTSDSWTWSSIAYFSDQSPEDRDRDIENVVQPRDSPSRVQQDHDTMGFNSRYGTLV